MTGRDEVVSIPERKCSDLKATLGAADNYLGAQVQRTLGSRSPGSTEDGVNPDYKDENPPKGENLSQENTRFFVTSMDTVRQIAGNTRDHVRSLAIWT